MIRSLLRSSSRPHSLTGVALVLPALLLVGTARGQALTEPVGSALALDTEWSTGAAWGDYDGDGDPDLVVTHLGNVPNAFYVNESSELSRTPLDLVATTPVNSHGACWGDYDNDGDLDLFVTNLNSGDYLYTNNGDGTFGLAQRNSTANERDCTWADYDGDGDLDLYLPIRFGSNNVLYRNDGGGTFVRVASGAIVSDGEDSTGATWADYDDDGDLDLFVTNVSAADLLYRNDGGGAFTPVTSEPMVTTAVPSSSASWGDYDRDGDLDLFVTRGLDGAGDPRANSLYRNDGGTFSAVLEPPFTTDVSHSTSSGWADYDNDGDLDLFVANFGPNALYRNDGGSFTHVEGVEPVLGSEDSRAVAWADADLDGDLDLAVTTEFGPDRYYVNSGTGNSFLNVRLVGTVSNASAIGAQVRVRATIEGEEVWQLQEVTSRTGRVSQGSLEVEFGLGDAAVVDELEVRWPSGIVQRLHDVAADQFITVVEAEDTEPPAITVRADTPVLWPPNHRYHAFDVGDLVASVSDDQDAEVSAADVVVTRVTSDEPENGRGDGNTTADAVIAEDCGGVRVRAERQGTGDGRVYTVHLAVADASGNVGTAAAEVHVPKSRQGSATDSGEAYGVEGSCAPPSARGAVASTDPTARSASGANVSTPRFVEDYSAAARAGAARAGAARTGATAHSAFGLDQNYPNPFRSATEIAFDVPEDGPVRLVVFDLLGREVAVLFDGFAEAGSHRVQFEGDGLPSGTYIYRLMAGTRVSTMRMVSVE